MPKFLIGVAVASALWILLLVALFTSSARQLRNVEHEVALDCQEYKNQNLEMAHNDHELRLEIERLKRRKQ